MDNYQKIAASFFNRPWAIDPAKMDELVAFMEIKMSGGSISAEDIQAAVGRDNGGNEQRAGAIAILPVRGVLSPRMNMLNDISGGTSYEMLGKQLRTLVSDSGVGAIILDIDSPGGSGEGLPEFAAEVFAARSEKKIVAIGNTQALSAAYWIGTAADELVALSSSWIGSVGVVMVHKDISKQLEADGVATTIISAGKFKTETSDLGPLSEEALVHLQENADHFYNMFVDGVAKNRGVSVSDVRSGFGEGRVMPAEMALKENMIDGIETMGVVCDITKKKRENNGY